MVVTGRVESDIATACLFVRWSSLRHSPTTRPSPTDIVLADSLVRSPLTRMPAARLAKPGPTKGGGMESVIKPSWLASILPHRGAQRDGKSPGTAKAVRRLCDDFLIRHGVDK
jgi:hypothetical protein